MKKVLFSIGVLFLLLSSFYSLALASEIPSCGSTTTEVIAFHDIPWGISGSEFLAMLDTFGISYEKETRFYGDNLLNLSSSSYGDGEIIPKSFSNHVETYCYDISPSKFFVAGHGVLFLDASFYSENNVISPGSGSLYEINISFKDHDLLSIDEQFNDLTKKLSSLYGDPYFYQEEDEMFTGDHFKYTYCVWIGSNSSAVYLQRSQKTNSTGIFSNRDSISLNYGLTSVTTKFQTIDERMQAIKEQKEQVKREALANDYSGL